MNRSMRRLSIASGIAMLSALATAPVVRADDTPVIASKLLISDNFGTGKVIVKGQMKHYGVHFGPASTPAQMSGSVLIRYVDTPGNQGLFTLPSPWHDNNGTLARFYNNIAPAGPSEMRRLSLTAGKIVKLDGRGLGDGSNLSIASSPGNNGVLLVVTVNNAADGSQHRMCTRFSTNDGSVIKYITTATRRKLLLKRGVGVPCPDDCADGAQNAQETDVDCGGPACPSCPDGGDCNTNSDCQSGVCVGGVCQVPTCTDTVKNGTETGVDCGNTCPDCPDGEGCDSNDDCTSSVCGAMICQAPTCVDGVENGTETGIDCGGSCPGCPDGGGCNVGSDCASGVCSAGVCQAPTCTDGVENGSETDVDCGGSCPACADGGGCSSGADCQNLICVAGICFPANCGDGVENGSETDIDCGGPTCPDCETGEGCSTGSDCEEQVCTAGLCAPPTCSDSVENGQETDVDCGGPICPDCTTGEGCNVGSDCASGVCSGGICQAPTCTDGIKNGSETGVDCGASCPTCPNGQGCTGNSDCTSGQCTSGICVGVNCGDAIQNGTETDVDCGGPDCLPCVPGETCSVASDCNSLVCTGSVCQAPNCFDGVKNGGEGDVDCGGGSCPLCVPGDTCLGNADCNSGFCNPTTLLCQVPTCTDGYENGNETDVDCGGDSVAGTPDCPDCVYGQDCNVAADCTTNGCAGVCVCGTQNYTLTMSSNDGGSVDPAEWPGGTQSANNGNAACSVTINRPSGNIDIVGNLGNKYTVNSFSGYSTCFGTGGEDGDGCQPNGCPPAGIGSCEATRPSCSAALNGTGSARFIVQCAQ